VKELQDIKVLVTDSGGDKMELTIPWDDTTDEWENHLKRIMVFLEFFVDEVVINPDKEQDPIGVEHE
jgi:anti-sigma regulatory factor (Ser/Thr protein kinase)